MTSLPVGSTLQNGKYEIFKVLGQGGFCITYLATHSILEKQVAIKEFFPKDFCNRDSDKSHITLGTSSSAELVAKLRVKFVKDAKNIAKLSHPNIVPIQDIFEENDTACYLMDYIEGVSLGDIIKRFIPLIGDNKHMGFINFGSLFNRESLYKDSATSQYYFYFNGHGYYDSVHYCCDYVCPVRLIKQKI